MSFDRTTPVDVVFGLRPGTEGSDGFAMFDEDFDAVLPILIFAEPILHIRGAYLKYV